MIVEVELQQDVAHFGFAVELDSITYQLSFRWNARAGRWFLDVRDGDGNALRLGVAMIPDAPLLRRFGLGDASRRTRSSTRPIPGELMLVDTHGFGADPGFEDLGRRHRLYHFLASDLA